MFLTKRNADSDEIADSNKEDVKKRRPSSEDETVEDQVADCGFEYLEHPADIQLHAWATSTEKAVEKLVEALYGYMTELDKVDEVYPYYFVAKGRDLHTLLFSILDEPLVAFQAEPFFVGKRVEVTSIYREGDELSCSFRAFGDSFDLNRHVQLADIKAITWSNMQITECDDKTDIYVIVDI